MASALTLQHTSEQEVDIYPVAAYDVGNAWEAMAEIGNSVEWSEQAPPGGREAEGAEREGPVLRRPHLRMSLLQGTLGDAWRHSVRVVCAHAGAEVRGQRWMFSPVASRFLRQGISLNMKPTDPARLAD